jgi:hypothetical protein
MDPRALPPGRRAVTPLPAPQRARSGEDGSSAQDSLGALFPPTVPQGLSLIRPADRIYRDLRFGWLRVVSFPPLVHRHKP